MVPVPGKSWGWTWLLMCWTPISLYLASEEIDRLERRPGWDVCLGDMSVAYCRLFWDQLGGAWHNRRSEVCWVRTKGVLSAARHVDRILGGNGYRCRVMVKSMGNSRQQGREARRVWKGLLTLPVIVIPLGTGRAASASTGLLERAVHPTGAAAVHDACPSPGPDGDPLCATLRCDLRCILQSSWSCVSPCIHIHVRTHLVVFIPPAMASHL